MPTHTKNSHHRSRKHASAFTAIVLSSVVLSACVTTQTFDEGIGYREARFAEVSAMRDFRQCRDDALELDQQARTTGDSAKYLASARMLEKCEASIGPGARSVAKDERMQAYALSIQNHLKGGDVAAARVNLEKFTTTYPDMDIYYADGSSFIDTVEVLLGMRKPSTIGRYSDANVNAQLKAELRRVHHWQTH
ncbi:MAG: hypothetical protein OQK24_02850 [Magnetovibrio sp.]|nr:hypothetical protein [Magnetovibrio sp.]